MDITNFMTWFLEQFYNLVKFVLDTLDSITMFGFSLLDFFLAMILIPIGLNLLVAIRKGADNGAYEYRNVREKKKAEKEAYQRDKANSVR